MYIWIIFWASSTARILRPKRQRIEQNTTPALSQQEIVDVTEDESHMVEEQTNVSQGIKGILCYDEGHLKYYF